MEDRAGGRIDVVSAVLAGVRPAPHDPVMLRDAGAGMAVDPVRKAAFENPLEACVVVRLECVDLDEQRPETLALSPHRGRGYSTSGRAAVGGTGPRRNAAAQRILLVARKMEIASLNSRAR
jgi:hypothetical protein